MTESAGVYVKTSTGLSQAATVPGPRGLLWRGAWDSLVAYAVNDAVSYNGASYRRVVAGTTATNPSADATNWALLAAKGDAGSAGPQGPQGPAGGIETLTTASVTGAYTVDASVATFHHLTLTGAVTLSLAGAAATGITSVSVQVTQDATGGRDVTWPSVSWLPGGAPVEDAGAGKSTLVMFWTTNAGTTWYGTYGAENPLAVGDTGWRLVGTTGEPIFKNGWVNYGDPYAKAAFRKDGAGTVHLRGLVKSGTVGQAIFTLPVGYRPAGPEGNLLNATISNSAIGRLDVVSDPAPVSGGNPGDVIAAAGNTAWISLDNITFIAGA